MRIIQANHDALCNNIATPVVIDNVSLLIKNMNIYMKRAPNVVKTTLLLNHHRYIFDTLGLFGLDYIKETSQTGGEERLNAVIDSIAEFRDQVIVAAALKEPKALFDITDRLRDEILPNHGIMIEDAGKGKASTWKMQDKESLLKEIASKKAEQLKIKEEKEKKAKELENKIKREPREIFADEDYKKFNIAQYDDKGIPTHNNKGEEFPAKVKALFEKDYAKHEKARDEWFKKQAAKQTSDANKKD